MRKFVAEYKEFEMNTDASLYDNISSKEIENKDKVLEYLKNGIDDGIRCASLYDYVEHKILWDAIKLYTDGEFYWNDEIIYHFEKYNMKLNQSFLDKITK